MNLQNNIEAIETKSEPESRLLLTRVSGGQKNVLVDFLVWLGYIDHISRFLFLYFYKLNELYTWMKVL